jgi:hypothetical protein
MQSFRIFVSSPRDVGSERALAAGVIDRLKFEFRGLIEIVPIFWEQMPMRATDTFQAQIPQAAEADLCIFILWSWFGTPLPEPFRRPDGRPYASGTEFEFETALDSHARTGTPDILVYRKTAELRASMHNREQVMERLAQHDAVQSFIERYFKGEGGTFKAAFREFEAPADFEETLETHLRELIRDRLRNDTGHDGTSAPLWTQSPFRGLQAFDLEHALIYCGRTRAVTDVLDALRRQAESGRPLILVIGTSGSGKSSLVRAGALPLLMQPRVIEDVVAWRYALMRPSDAREGGPMASLAAALLQASALPDLAAGGTDAATLADILRTKPAALLPSLALVIDRVAEQTRQTTPEVARPGPARLALVVDQLEELFSAAIPQSERDAFATAMVALARSGLVWVMATLRADFYHHCGELPDDFGELVRGEGTYELRPPRAAEIAQMIRRPAQIAGLSFERRPEAEEGLDDVLRDAAAASPAALPLLQFALDELYKRRSGNMLSFAGYEALGGLEGALRQRAEEEFAKLSEPVRAALPATLSGLVRIGLEDEAVASRRVPRSRFAAIPGASDLADAFVAARLFVADRSEGDEATIGVAHEALLHQWPRARSWIDDNKELLRTRARVAAAATIWEGSGRDPARLLPAGRALAETQAFLGAGGFDLSPITAEFIAASQRHAAQRRRRRRQAYAVAAAVLAALLFGTGWYYDGYIYTKVRYYGGFERRFGITDGSGLQLSQERASHRGISFKFYYAGRYGLTKGWEYINGHGYCPQYTPFETHLGPVKHLFLSNSDLCHFEPSYQSGKIASELGTDRNGRPVMSFIYSDADRTMGEYVSGGGAAMSLSQSGASRVRFVRIAEGPQRGLEREVLNLDAYGRAQPDRDSRYGSAFEYNDRGFVTRIAALGEHDHPTVPRNGIAITEFKYDSAGNRTDIAYFDEQGQAMLNPASGAAAQKMEYDEYGNMVALTLLDETGKTTKGTAGYARETFAHNAAGDTIELAAWDADGRRVRTTSGWARLARGYDEQGRITVESYFGEDGSPIALASGESKIRRDYDAHGDIVELIFLDRDDKPVTIAAGYARMGRDYDENGNEIAEYYRDQNGALVNTKDGSAQVQIKLDANGHPIDIVFLDKLGNRIAVTNGYAEIKQTYDTRGNLTEQAFFGIAGKPAFHKDGYARVRRAYDDRGNLVELVDFGVDGKLVLLRGIPWRLKFEYDERNRLVRTIYLDAEEHEVAAEVIVLRVNGASPAEQLGLEVGDRLLSYGGQKLTSVDQTVALITDATLGARRALMIRRAGKILTLEAPAGRLGIELAVVPTEAQASHSD